MRVPELVIRPAEFGDLDAMYSICLRTGAAGADASDVYRDGDLLGHVYVGPYVLMESGFGFALTADDTVVGYALATADTAEFEDECATAWWPALRRRYAEPEPTTVDAGDPDAGLLAAVHRPDRTAAGLAAAYPAHLHIDLLAEAQGSGAGRRLMAAVEEELRRRGATGVHLGTDPGNVRAQGFYEHLGYRRLAPGEYGIAPGAVVFVKDL